MTCKRLKIVWIAFLSRSCISKFWNCIIHYHGFWWKWSSCGCLSETLEALGCRIHVGTCSVSWNCKSIHDLVPQHQCKPLVLNRFLKHLKTQPWKAHCMQQKDTSHILRALSRPEVSLVEPLSDQAIEVTDALMWGVGQWATWHTVTASQMCIESSKLTFAN
jgi:hypothetical protein